MLTADRAVCVNVSPIAVLTRDQIQATSKEIRCTLASSTTCSKRTNTCSLNRAHTDGPCMTLTTCSSISPMPVSIFAKSQDDGRCAGAHRRPPNTHHANTTRVHRRAQKPRKNSNVPCLARSSMSMCMHDQVSRMLCGARLQNAVRFVRTPSTAQDASCTSTRPAGRPCSRRLRLCCARAASLGANS